MSGTERNDGTQERVDRSWTVPHRWRGRGGVRAAGFGCWVARLVHLQVVRTRSWTQAENNRIAVVPIVAQPRPDRRPQRRRAGQQLLGLHAGDHALAGDELEPPSTLAEVVDIQPRDRAASSACWRSQELRVAADPHRLTDEEVARFARSASAFPAWTSRRAVPQLPAGRGRQPPARLHRPHQPGREAAHRGLGRGRRQLPRHRVHRQAGRRAELRGRAARPDRLRGGRDQRRRPVPVRRLKSNPRRPGNKGGAVAGHQAAGAGRAAVRRPARRAGGARPAQRRGAGLRQQADLRPNLFVDGIDARTGRSSTSRSTSRCSTARCAAPTRRARPSSPSWRWPR